MHAARLHRGRIRAHEVSFPVSFFPFLSYSQALMLAFHRAGLGSHRNESGQCEDSHCGGGFQAGGAPIRRRRALKAAFDATLYNDLGNAGIFDLVSKSITPQATPGSPQEINLAQWSAAAGQCGDGGFWRAFGEQRAADGLRLAVRHQQHRQSAGAGQAVQRSGEPGYGAARSRTGLPTRSSARLGGGINGIAETKIYFVSTRTGNKEIWVMDYDGQNQHQSRTWAPFRSRRASRRITRGLHSLRWAARDGRSGCIRWIWAGWSASRRDSRRTNHRRPGQRDGTKIAFSSARTGDPEIWVADASGGAAQRLTASRGPDVSPTWNPTHQRADCVGERTHRAAADLHHGSGRRQRQRITDGGYAISPSWSPNGAISHLQLEPQVRAGRPGGQDIYVMDIASKRWMQLTHDAGQQRFSVLGAGRPAHRL